MLCPDYLHPSGMERTLSNYMKLSNSKRNSLVYILTERKHGKKNTKQNLQRKIGSNVLAASLMGKSKIQASTPEIFRGRKIFTFLLFTQCQRLISGK